MANREKTGWKLKFIRHLSVTGHVSDSAQAAGVSRAMVYKHRAAETAFQLAWDDAVEQGLDTLEYEARRRALDGWDEPVFYEGEECGVKRKFSDSLMMFLLKGGRPKKYRDYSKVESDVTVKLHPNMAALYEAAEAEGTGTDG